MHSNLDVTSRAAILSERVSAEWRYSSFVDVLRRRAVQQADSRAFIFLWNGENESEWLTYQQLDERARIIAARLQQYGMNGQRVLLHYAAGLEFICALFGCLYAGVVAVPTFPPTKRNDKLLRLQRIAEDCQAAAMLTTRAAHENIRQDLATSPILSRLQYIASDELTTDAEMWRKPEIDLQTLGILQYTSGSTGSPKGVMLNHGNLLHNQRVIERGFEHTANSIGVSWLPLFHDMGLIGNILQVVYLGIQVTLMSPESFVQKPVRWLQAISRYRATTSGGPDFAYDLCVRKITEEQKAALDLTSWEVAYTGAEPIRRQTLERFAEAFAPCGFRYQAFHPCYGMAESTLMITGGRKTLPPIFHEVDTVALGRNAVEQPTAGAPSQSVVGCGHLLEGQKVIIVNPETKQPCNADQIGEIWVSGPSVGQGYWNRPELTEHCFCARLANDETETFLRTGDLGFLRQHNLFVTGRLKDLIIIRGRNHYPQEIEQTIRETSHSALRHCYGAAFSLELEGEERLIIVHEIDRSYLRKLDVDEVAAEVCRAVSEQHGLQVAAIYLLRPMKLPRTSSGKIRRNACRSAFLANSLDPVARWGMKLNDAVSFVNPETNKRSGNEADDLIKWLREYAPQRINSRLIDERRCIPPYIVLDLGNRGLLGMQIAKQYGGLGLSYQDTMRVFVQLAGIDLTLASFVGVHHILGTRPIMNYASPAVQEELLPLIASGRELASFAITEPGAGSNPRNIAATAIPVGNDKWRLRGEKIWIGSASWSGLMNVFVQQQNAAGQLIGITGFVLRQGARGLRQGPEALTLGMRGMVQNAVFFDDVETGKQDMLGQAGEGMSVANDAMLHGRFGLGAISLGGMQRCAQLMLRYAERRSVSTGRLLDNPLTLVRLNGLTASISAMDALLIKIAELLDSGCSPPEEAFIACKTAGPELLWQAADNLVQLLGGRGYIETNYAPQILRDARLLRIFEGPTETLNMYLGSRVIHQGNNVLQFLTHDLRAPAVATRLKNVTEQILDRCTGAQKVFDESSTASRWAALLVGEVTTNALLYAAAQQSLGTVSAHRVAEWSKLRFEQSIQQALTLSPGESAVNSAQATADWISSYKETIGDLEQTLAGEDYQLDPLLRKAGFADKNEPVLADETVPSVTKETLTKATQDGLEQPALEAKETSSRSVADNAWRSAETIQDWLVTWLAKQLNKPAATIDVSRSFFDFGLDSVMAVELIQDLEDWFGNSLQLDATLVWSFPTIESMSRRLAAEGVSATDSPSLVSTPLDSQVSITEEITMLSENEMEASIAEEVAVLEDLLRRNDEQRHAIEPTNGSE